MSLETRCLGKWKTATTICLAHWPLCTKPISDSHASTAVLEARQAGHQSKRPLLSISDTRTEALWLIHACTERVFGSLFAMTGWDDHWQFHLSCYWLFCILRCLLHVGVFIPRFFAAIRSNLPSLEKCSPVLRFACCVGSRSKLGGGQPS